MNLTDWIFDYLAVPYYSVYDENGVLVEKRLALTFEEIKSYIDWL